MQIVTDNDGDGDDADGINVPTMVMMMMMMMMVVVMLPTFLVMLTSSLVICGDLLGDGGHHNVTLMLCGGS